MRSQQYNIDVIADNVANVSTTGYKRARADFKDALYNRMRNPVDNGLEMNLQHGTGSIPLQTNRIFFQGITQETGRALDFMIEGRGFFTIQGDDGTPLYSRDGTFYLDAEGSLVDAQGRFVLDGDGNQITFTTSPETMTVSPEGYLMFTGENGENIDSGIRLGIVDFLNPAGLLSMGSNYFTETDNSGAAEPMDTPNVINGALEGSNVDYALEATRLMRAQRAYQLASRAITTADQMAGLANSIRP